MSESQAAPKDYFEDEDEVQTISHTNEAKTEFTYVVKSPSGRALTNNEVILELEYLINEISRADDQLNQPGVNRH